MAGPGGGSRGGGFGGGSRGGFSGGGGFGGGRPPRHHHHYYGGGWFFRPRYYGYGGGCLGGFLGILIAPIIMLVLALALIFSSFGPAIETIKDGGAIVYDEERFQKFADEQYREAFSSYGGYEDNLLIVFLTNEEYDDFYCIAWIGDNVRDEIIYLFGDETSEFGRAVLSSISDEYYAYSLDTSIASIMRTMANEVKRLGLSSSFDTAEAVNQIPASKLNNKTELDLTADTVNKALEEFTAETSIPAVVCVEDMNEVFEKSIFTTDVIFSFFGIGLIALTVFLIVRSVITAKKAKKNKETNNGSGRRRDDNIFDNDNFG